MYSQFVLANRSLVFRLRNGDGLLGRDTSCDLVILNETVSRRHAQIRLDNELLVVRDLDSTNGTFVDSVRISEAVAKLDQTVRFGDVNLVFQAASELTEPETSSLDSTSEELVQRLSRAQRRVLKYLLRGESEKNIAWILGCSHHTIHNHIRAIYAKLGVRSRGELMSRLVGKVELTTGH
ncbi:MAG TPA: FHA domain-containing protein [Pirellulaceae bacterium]|nr:FHA domain-containing protein [Pirellulaceae bacterium]HMO91367.1 FHA domain-containing protein [Pirellulaceae bacterium]HMP70241.1 FHA domain-containing protein [Pirellulaceae bacterium]